MRHSPGKKKLMCHFSLLIKTQHRFPLENYSRKFPVQKETASENRKLS